MEFTGERYLPTEQGEIRLEHVHRYALALAWARGKRVLDVACGEGYGTRLLSTVAASVDGVDISAEAVAHARGAYGHLPNARFHEGSAARLPFEDRSFDLVVSFETLEHLSEQSDMVAEIRRVLEPEGLLVISSPNRPVYSRGGEFRNEFHVKELDHAELDALLRPVFPAIRYLGQGITAGSLVQPLEAGAGALEAWADDGRDIVPGLPARDAPVYFLALCAASESLLPPAPGSFAQPAGDDLLEAYRNHARWAVRADRELERVRGLYAQLQADHDKAVGWAKQSDEEAHRVSDLHRALQAEHERIAAWASDLDRQGAERLAEATAAQGRATALEEELARERAGREETLARQALELKAVRETIERLAQEKQSLETALKAQETALKAQETALKAQETALGKAHAEANAAEALAAATLAKMKAAESRVEDAERRADAAEALAGAAQEEARAALSRAAASEERARAGEARLAAEIAAREALAARAAQLEATARHHGAQVAAYTNSLSWRVTAPLRWGAGLAVSGARSAFHLARETALRLGRAGLRLAIPSEFERRKWRGAAFARLPILFRGSAFYASWHARQPQVAALAARLAAGDAKRLGNLVPREDAGGRPRVSVIIPIYGQLDYTLRCLQSTLDVVSRTSFELVVVDDCSPDESVEALAALPAIRFVGNDANQGFIRTCNHGARVARGEFLLFLNNDTVVQEGWLDELIFTFDDVPECGLAGSMLLYPDGHLQEAGGIIWADGSGWNYGRLDDPFKPQYAYRRDVDYCSGASLLVRADLFAQLGGFDEHYLPAYGEDSDLAFRVRRAGKRVLYQPRSRVIHYEGITSGTDLSQGAKAYQVANAKKLFERWKDVLAQYGTPGENPHLARDRNLCGRVLVIDHCTPTPDQDAGSITTVNLMRILQSFGFKVTFIPEDNLLYLQRYTTELERAGIECLVWPHVASLKDHLAALGHTYDAVVLFRVENAIRHLDDIELHCPQAKVVFHTSDLHFLRTERQAELEDSDTLRRHAARLKEQELSAIGRCSATIVHSAAEKTLLDDLLGWREKSRLFVHGWAIPIPGTAVPFRERDGIVFVGGYQHTPNVDAVDWFVTEIFPLVRKRLPKARFLIVGSKAPERFASLGVEGVEYVGFVAHLKDVFDRCRLSVAPLRYGAGIKGKIYTSMSHGLPCASTTVGAEGMGLVHGEDVLVADTPEALAEQIVRLHEDEALWNRLQKGGYEHLHAHASLEAGRIAMEGLLSSVGLPDGPRAISKPAPGSPEPREVIATDRASYEAFLATEAARRQRMYEERTIRRHAPGGDSYSLKGWCEVCEGPRTFGVDILWGGERRDDGLWVPNWRERCTCVTCHMNTRQRAIAARARDRVRARGGAGADVYLTEQVTAIFAWMQGVPGARCVGSEYLGPGIAGGTRNAAGIRHEDVERLSFGDGCFDLIISNDVLEHVVDPRAALREMLRVLRPGGVLLMTVPFHTNLDAGLTRARIEGGELVHRLPPVYHGNPISEDGSLVFTDFGWDFLDQMREAGFAEVALHLYWDESRGYFGVGQHYIRACRP